MIVNISILIQTFLKIFISILIREFCKILISTKYRIDKDLEYQTLFRPHPARPQGDLCIFAIHSHSFSSKPSAVDEGPRTLDKSTCLLMNSVQWTHNWLQILANLHLILDYIWTLSMQYIILSNQEFNMLFVSETSLSNWKSPAC